ncbi:MAG TPA: hypothetical protein VFU54_17000 [Actinomycetota bacterium]|nr:hypothetical protein [Actinomycetota bacterium]
MRPRDYDPSEDPDVYLARLEQWETRQGELLAAVDAADGAVVAAEQALATLQGLADRLARLLDPLARERDALAASDIQLATLAAELDELDGLLADYTAARELATARLVGGPAAGTPLVLLPLRLQARWLDDGLHVRIYPDELGVDTHDPTLTAEESRWAEHYWQVRSGAVEGDVEETWHQLVRRSGPTRAAWLVEAAMPGGPGGTPRPGPLPRPALVRLLPDRFAVVAFAAGVPMNVAPPGEPPRYVTWSSRVPSDLPLAIDDAPGAAWWNELGAAHASGMAVRLTPPAGHAPIDTLVAVGVRGVEPGESAADTLAALVAAHAVSSGVELLADATPTNNAEALRSGHSPQAQERAARAVRDAVLTPPGPGPATSASVQLAAALGVPRRALAGLAGADADRDTVPDAVRLLVGLGTGGALRRSLGAEAAWPLLRPDGPFPAVRVGRQPYGVLPVTAPGRWVEAADEAAAALAPALHAWAAATGPVVATDPGAPPRPVGGGPARTESDDLDTLLLEAASSLRWAPAAAPGGEVPGPGYDGLDALVGPDGGPASASLALTTVADTPAADLPGLPEPTRAGSLLARIAVAAKRAAPAEAVEAVDAALRILAGTGREQLARALCELLDAASHRFDAWVTAAVTERLASQRTADPGDTVVGAVGWVTDVAPRTLPRSFGHVHAPSVGHAATAAVLRSAFLGERRRAWSGRVDAAAAETAALGAQLGDPTLPPGERARLLAELRTAEQRLTAATDGARTLPPLDLDAERRLPLAVDLSSRRLRGALRVLAAVRAGQPLAAVLGHGFERALADAGLLHHLAPFRKLTRFRTGTALEALELDRQERRTALAAARTRLAELQHAAGQLRAVLDAAEEVLQAAQARLDAAEQRYTPFAEFERQLAAADTTVQQRAEELARSQAERPAATRTPFRVTLP